MFSRLLANDGMVGVDIGSSSIKVVRAEAADEGIRISHIAMCPTPPDSIAEGVVVNVPEVAAAIQFAMRSAGIKASGAVAAVAGPGVVVRHVQVPKMTEQVLRKSLQFEAGKYISSSVEDSIVEFEILGDAEDGQMNVLLVAAPKAMVESRVSLLEQAGLDPLSIDIEAFATVRALIEHNNDQSILQSTIALLDIGASNTEINLVRKGNLELTRTIPIAGVSLTNAIKNAENCTEAEAEQRKCSLDLSELVELPSGTTPNPGLKVLQPLVDELLREIRRSVNFHQSQLPEGAAEAAVDRLVLTGGTAMLKGLLPYANSRLKMDVGIGNPALGKLIDLSSDCQLNEEDIPFLTVALGLAIKEISAAAHVPAAAA